MILKGAVFDIFQGIKDIVHQIDTLKEDIEEVKKQQSKTEARLNKIDKPKNKTIPKKPE